MSSAEVSPPDAWRDVAKRRILWSRILSFGLIGSTTIATYFFLVMYNYPTLVIAPFLIAYCSLGYLGMTYFVGMWFGFFAALRGLEQDPYHPIHRARDLDPETRIAVLMPVYHEDPRRIGAGLGAMWEDLRKHPEADQIDFFILSDSRKTNSVIQEEWMVHTLSDMYPDGRFTYRHRTSNVYAKLGNVSDFLRRWGDQYRYLVMLDADSILPAESIVKMARIIEGNDRIGLIQAHLSMVFRNTLYARISRFISAFTLRIGFYGQYFFYLGQGYYYGHNAIIRTQAFIDHCGLPILKKFGPWAAGKPISHDYVEAALLEGAGYEVWSLPEIESFEELPTNLIDDMQREMRWMYGSLLYLRVFLIARISGLYKARLFTSAVNYLNPLLGWIFFFMGLFGLLYIFRHPIQSYEIMQTYGPIFIFTLAFLAFSILAKMALPIIYHWKTNTTHHYGGLAKMTWSYFLFFIYSLAIGPIYMAQLTRMLYYWVKGEKIQWGEQNRDDRSLTWGEAFHHFWWLSALGCLLFWLVTRYVFSADTAIVQAEMNLSKWDLLFWYVPMLFGMTTSVWLSRFLSLEIPSLEKLGWFQSPQEVEPAFVLRETQRLLPIMETRIPETLGLHEAVEDPWFYRHHWEMCMERPVKFAFWSARLRGRRLDDLTPGEARIMLNERGLYDAAHHAMWAAE